MNTGTELGREDCQRLFEKGQSDNLLVLKVRKYKSSSKGTEKLRYTVRFRIWGDSREYRFTLQADPLTEKVRWETTYCLHLV